MIVCPKCGSDTRVEHTYKKRRQRICKDITCNARLSTVEIAREDLTMMRRLFDAMENVDE